MDFASATLRAATCVLALLVSSQFTPTSGQTIQQDQTMTAASSAPSKSDACTASSDKALLGHARAWRSVSNEDIDIRRNKLRYELREPIVVSFRPAKLKTNARPLNVAEFAEPRSE
jgi:hypothetical protein